MTYINKTEVFSRHNMSECVMLIALAKFPAGERDNFSWP